MTDFTLDHVALVTSDLERSRRDYERLGFALTDESSHKGRITPDGPVVPWGSGNRCAMFRRGYFEILGLTDASRFHAHFDAALKRYQGVTLVALGCDDAGTLYTRRKNRIAGLKPPAAIGRDVPYGKTTREGRFQIVHLEEDVFPEAELFFIEHETPSVLWQESLMEHPNHVVGLAGVTFCADNPEETAARFEYVTRVGGSAKNSRPHFQLSRGEVSILEPADIEARYPEVTLPAVPSVAVVSLIVSDFAAARACLEGNDVTTHAGEDGTFWIKPERTGGVILEFRGS